MDPLKQQTPGPPYPPPTHSQPHFPRDTGPVTMTRREAADAGLIVTDPPPSTTPAWLTTVAGVIIALCTAYTAWQSSRNSGQIAEVHQAANVAAAEAKDAKKEAAETHRSVRAMRAPANPPEPNP
jgi:hypothetical protein